MIFVTNRYKMIQYIANHKAASNASVQTDANGLLGVAPNPFKQSQVIGLTNILR